MSTFVRASRDFLRKQTLVQPPYLATGVFCLTICNLLLGEVALYVFGHRTITWAIIQGLIVLTLFAPPLSLFVLSIHYKESASSIKKIVSLYLSLVVICATLNLGVQSRGMV